MTEPAPLTVPTGSMNPRGHTEGEFPIELSVVMPCLNEADTLATCISRAQAALRENGIAGEVIVADNGSRDESVGIAAVFLSILGMHRR